MKKSSLLLVAFGLVAAACGGDPMMSDDAGPGLPDARVGDGGMGGRDGGPSNDTFGGARPVTVDGTAVMDAIERPGDRDFWRFEGMAGQWVVISTTANADDDPMMIDTVITLYDSTRTQIAENDDGQPRTSTDSEIVIQLPMTGTYYIEVQEFSTWDTMAGLEPEGMPSFRYDLAVLPLTAGGAFNIDTETGDDLASAQALVFGGMMSNIAFILGGFNDATDVDAYSFTVSGAARQLLSTDVMPAGVDGYGSTRAAARIWVSDAAGTTVVARIQPRDASQSDISPSLPAGNYILWVDAGGGTAGSNDHYVLKALLGQENPIEAEVAAGENDTSATAEALAMMDDAGVSSGFILSQLTTDTDVEYFSFDVAAGREVNIPCGSASSGSGVTGLSIQLLGPDGTTVLGMDPEDATGAFIGPIAITTGGTHYLRISKTGQSAEVTGTFVRCAVRHAVPMAP